VEVPIFKQGAVLIATFQAALSDADLNQLRMGWCSKLLSFAPVRLSSMLPLWT
jgi:hypothetical protein